MSIVLSIQHQQAVTYLKTKSTYIHLPASSGHRCRLQDTRVCRLCTHFSCFTNILRSEIPYQAWTASVEPWEGKCCVDQEGTAFDTAFQAFKSTSLHKKKCVHETAVSISRGAAVFCERGLHTYVSHTCTRTNANIHNSTGNKPHQEKSTCKPFSGIWDDASIETPTRALHSCWESGIRTTHRTG